MAKIWLKLGVVGLTGFGLTGCISMNSPLAYDFGAAVKQNISLHEIQPEPDDLDPPEMDGMVGAAGVFAYRAGDTEEADAEDTKSD